MGTIWLWIQIHYQELKLKWNHKRCYERMERIGIACFGCCKGVSKEVCGDEDYPCPYFVDVEEELVKDLDRMVANETITQEEAMQILESM